MSVLINPRFPNEEAEELKRQLTRLTPLKDLVWIATSGSTCIKWTALSRAAIESSAHAVNTLLASDKSDVWLNPLPFFHVGGLGIVTRAQLSGAAVVDFGKWEPSTFHRALYTARATLTALVPAQVYDLVMLQLSPPASLRAVVVGGGALQESLYAQAVAIGWKLLPSYGMTECASQIATADLSEAGAAKMPPLRLLPHVEARLSASGHLQIKSRALFTCYALKQDKEYQIVDPKKEGWFETEDRATFSQATLQILGRDSNFIKIGGESCDLKRLEAILEDLKLAHGIQQDVALIAVKDARLGHLLHLAIAGETAPSHFVEAFQERVLPFERIRKIHYLKRLPRTDLSKLILPELKKLIGET